VLVSEGLNVYGLDVSPSFVEAFQSNLPGVPVACQSVNDLLFFNRMFDGAVAWGLTSCFGLKRSGDSSRDLLRYSCQVVVFCSLHAPVLIHWCGMTP
jgi:hypothetical protein